MSLDQSVVEGEVDVGVGEREVVRPEGGIGKIGFRVDGKRYDGTPYECGYCHGDCVNPVVLFCNHVGCRDCLDTCNNKCPTCFGFFFESDYFYLDQSLGPDWYEYEELLGVYGRGRGVKYAVKWRAGQVTFEPARNIPVELPKKYLQERRKTNKTSSSD